MEIMVRDTNGIAMGVVWLGSQVDRIGEEVSSAAPGSDDSSRNIMTAHDTS